MRQLSDTAGNGRGTEPTNGKGRLRHVSTVVSGTRSPAKGDLADSTQRHPIEVVGWFTDAELGEQARHGRRVCGLSPVDPRLPPAPDDRRDGGSIESVVPIAGAKEGDTGPATDSPAPALRNGKKRSSRAERLLSKALEDEFVARAKADLESVVPSGDIHEFVQGCIKGTRVSLTVAKAAESAGLDVPGITKLLDAAGYPPADDIMLWCRILRAGWFLTRMPQRSGERIADTLGFGSVKNLRKTIQELTRIHVAHLATDASYSILMPEFCRRLREVSSTQLGAPAAFTRH